MPSTYGRNTKRPRERKAAVDTLTCGASWGGISAWPGEVTISTAHYDLPVLTHDDVGVQGSAGLDHGGAGCEIPEIFAGFRTGEI